jgi:UDP-glucose 4-epimerase
MAKMKILVTGGAGFIGSHLVDKLVELGHEVVVIDNLATGKRENVNSKAHFIVKDIRDDLSEVFEKGFDCVFHFAAQMNVRKSLENPKEDADINIVGSLNIVENCVKVGVKKIIFSSTGGAIYSSDAALPCKEDSKVEPLSPYGLAKFTIENYLRIVKENKGLNFVALRFANVYGPRQNAKGEAGVISIFSDQALNGKSMVIFGDGEQTRDFVFVDDVVRASLKAMDLSGVFNVSTGIEVSINNIALKVKEVMGANVEIKRTDAISGELLRSCLSFDKLSCEGWSPKVDLSEGLKKTVDWFRNNS